jgi:hypothetical protein
MAKVNADFEKGPLDEQIKSFGSDVYSVSVRTRKMRISAAPCCPYDLEALPSLVFRVFIESG